MARYCPSCGLAAHPSGHCDDVRSPEGLFCPWDGFFGRHRRCALPTGPMRVRGPRCAACGGALMREDRMDVLGRSEMALVCLLCGRESAVETSTARGVA